MAGAMAAMVVTEATAVSVAIVATVATVDKATGMGRGIERHDVFVAAI